MKRKNVLKHLAALALLLFSTYSLATTQTIRFATLTPNAPFVMLTPNNEFYGFDIDLAKAICQELKAQYVFSSEKMVSLIPSLKSNKYDAMIGGISITAERQKEIAFSTPYYTDESAMLTSDPSITNAKIDTLKNKTIGASDGTTNAALAQNIYGNVATIKLFLTAQDQTTVADTAALNALKTGKIAAVIDDNITLKTWLNQQKNRSIYHIFKLPADPILTKQTFGIAIAPNNAPLLKQMNAVLAKLKANGTLQALTKKYFTDPK